MNFHKGNATASNIMKEGLNIWCRALQVLPVQLILISDRDIVHRAYSPKRQMDSEERGRAGAEIRELRSDQGLDDISWGSCPGNAGACNQDSDKSDNKYPVAVSQTTDYTRTYVDDTVRERVNTIEISDLPGGSRLVTINSRVFVVGSEESAYSSSNQCEPTLPASKDQNVCCQQKQLAQKPQQNLACPKQTPGRKPIGPPKQQQHVPSSSNMKDKREVQIACKKPPLPSAQQSNIDLPGVLIANFKVITPNNQTFIIKFIDNRQLNNAPLLSPNPANPDKSLCQIENKSKSPCKQVDRQQAMLCQNLPSGPGSGWLDPEPYETQRFGGIKGERRVFEGQKDGQKIRGEVIMAGRPIYGGCMKVGESRFDYFPD